MDPTTRRQAEALLQTGQVRQDALIAIVGELAGQPHGGDLCSEVQRRGLISAELAEQVRRSVAGASAVPSAGPTQTDPSEQLERLGSLGKGGMGEIFRVRDHRLDREAALKVLYGEAARDPEAIERFFREASITARLTHPSIPPIYEYGHGPDGAPWLLMQLIDGRTLAELVKSARENPDPGVGRRRLVGLVETVARVIAFAHDRGVLHRDIKAANVMVGPFGEVLVMDWGLARELSAEPDDPADSVVLSSEDAAAAGLTIQGAVVGTPGMMPPEQAEGRVVDERADVFALGALLCEVLTGEPPVDRSGGVTPTLMRTVTGDIRTPRRLDRSVPRDLDGIAAGALAAEPEERTTTALAFADQLRQWLDDAPVDGFHYTPVERAGVLFRRSPGKVAAVVVILLALAGGFAGWSQLRLEQQRLEDSATQAKERLKVEAERAKFNAEQLELSRKLLEFSLLVVQEDRTEALLAELIDLCQADPERLLLVATEARRKGLLSKSAEICDAVLKSCPKHPKALYQRHVIAVSDPDVEPFSTTRWSKALADLPEEPGSRAEPRIAIARILELDPPQLPGRDILRAVAGMPAGSSETTWLEVHLRAIAQAKLGLPIKAGKIIHAHTLRGFRSAQHHLLTAKMFRQLARSGKRSALQYPRLIASSLKKACEIDHFSPGSVVPYVINRLEAGELDAVKMLSQVENQECRLVRRARALHAVLRAQSIEGRDPRRRWFQTARRLLQQNLDSAAVPMEHALLIQCELGLIRPSLHREIRERAQRRFSGRPDRRAPSPELVQLAESIDRVDLDELKSAPNIVVLCAYLFAALGDLDKCDRHLEAAWSTGTNRAIAVRSVLQRHLVAGDTETALAMMAQRRAETPDVVLIYAEVYRRAGLSEKALETLSEMLAKEGVAHDIIAQAAQLLVTLGDVRRGFALVTPFETAARDEYLLTLGYCEAKRKEWIAAELRLRPFAAGELASPLLFLNLARISLELQRPTQARKDLEHARTFGASPYDLELMEIRFLWKQGEVQKAWQRIGGILSRNKRDVMALALGAELALKLKQLEQARIWAQQGLAMVPQHLQLIEVVIDCRIARGELQGLEEEIEETISFPALRTPTLLSRLGDIKLRQGRLLAARKELQEALDMVAHDSGPFLGALAIFTAERVAALSLKLDDYGEALRISRRLTQSKPCQLVSYIILATAAGKLERTEVEREGLRGIIKLAEPGPERDTAITRLKELDAAGQ